jgi:predicted RNase H-like nuclease (RuvC/YqgF family)
MTDQPPPRRRSADRERRRWNETSFDLLKQDVEDNADAIQEMRMELRPLLALPTRLGAEFERLDTALKGYADRLKAQERAFEEWKIERREDLVELRAADNESKRAIGQLSKTIEEFKLDNARQHQNVAYGKDPIDGRTVLPPTPATLTWGAVAKVAVIMGTFFTAAATIVAAMLTAG